MKMDFCGRVRRLPSSRFFTSSKLPTPLSSFPRAPALHHPDLNTDSPSCCPLPPPSSSSSLVGSSSLCSISPPVSQSSQVHRANLLWPYTQSFRFYRPDRRRRKMEQVIQLIRSRPDDLRLKLDSLNARLPVSSLVRVFLAMNGEKIPALEFLHWFRASFPEQARHPDICSLAIDNCGRVDDCRNMVALLQEFSLKGVCLNGRAFGFLNVLASSRTSIKDSVRNMIAVLKRVGGSCLESGVCSLIEMFSSSGSVDIARYVIQITEEKVSYYNILVKGMGHRGDFQVVKSLLSEMKQSSCNPNVGTYNYFISSLCRNNRIKEAREMLEEMKGSDCPPNALTFEILICYYLRTTREVDIALELLEQLVSMNIKPRLTTGAAFVKAYFHSERREEAYEFVTSTWVQIPINVKYSLLAGLYQKEGNLVEAHKVLVEMMGKGLKPNWSVYRRVVRHLVKAGKMDLAQNLAGSLHQLIMEFGSDANLSGYRRILRHLIKAGETELAQNLAESIDKLVIEFSSDANWSVYRRVVSHLVKAGETDLAQNLAESIHKLIMQFGSDANLSFDRRILSHLVKAGETDLAQNLAGSLDQLIMKFGSDANWSVYKRVLSHLVKAGETDLTQNVAGSLAQLIMQFGSDAG